MATSGTSSILRPFARQPFGSYPGCSRRVCRGERFIVKALPVEVTFKITKHLQYGLHMAVTGSDEQLGAWDGKRGLKLVWNEGHVWSATIKLQPE